MGATIVGAYGVKVSEIPAATTTLLFHAKIVGEEEQEVANSQLKTKEMLIKINPTIREEHNCPNLCLKSIRPVYIVR